MCKGARQQIDGLACERVGAARAINDLLFEKGVKETVMVIKSPKRKKIGALSI